MDNNKNQLAQSCIEGLQDTLEGVLRLSEDVARGPGGREVALAITNIQQGVHWLQHAQSVDS